MKTVLITGSAWSLNQEAKLATRVVGRALAENGFGLVAGSWPGVDRMTAEAFLTALDRRSHSADGRFTQIHYRRRRPWTVVAPRDPKTRVVVESGQHAYDEAIRRCDAGIMIGGIGGAREVARELIESDRPVFPLPLTGGDAVEAYAETLERWSNHPVPGMTRAQFMSLSVPIRDGADALVRLLRAALQDYIDVFISYRRSDVPGVAGRITDWLTEFFGPRRVFLDTASIPPGAAFPARIKGALDQCRVMICVIGRDWNPGRLADSGDYVRREIETVLDAGTPVLPILAHGGSLPTRDDLPPSLHGLLDRHAERIDDNTMWDAAIQRVIAEVDRIVGDAAVRITPAATELSLDVAGQAREPDPQRERP